MFTGLVEGRGRVIDLKQEANGVLLRLAPEKSLTARPTGLGDSVAINGCCLTVIENTTSEEGVAVWSFQAGSETLSRTNLGRLVAGSVVNLERSLTPASPLGGHIVQGHVDCIATLRRIALEGEWKNIWFELDPEFGRLTVPKGSIAVDGVSLTVVESHPNQFSVALIPHTLSMTTLGLREVGDVVNIEIDILGKYVDKLLSARLAQLGAVGGS